MIELLRKELRHVVLSVPYNSFAPVMAISRLPTPHGFGGNCIYQVDVLANALRERTSDPVIFLSDGRHHAVVVMANGSPTYYFDPYLMPLDLIEIPTRRGRVAVPAYPRIGGKAGMVTLERSGESVRVRKHLARPVASDFYQTHQFTFHLGTSRKDSLPEVDDRLIALHPEVTTLSVRVVVESGEMISYAYSIPNRARYIVGPLMSRHYPDDLSFRPLFEQMLATLRTEQHEFMEYTELGIEAYTELTANMEIEYTYPNAITGGIVHGSAMDV